MGSNIPRQEANHIFNERENLYQDIKKYKKMEKRTSNVMKKVFLDCQGVEDKKSYYYNNIYNFLVIYCKRLVFIIERENPN